MAFYDHLNDRQKEALLCTEGPELILAGAGSGKTGVLTNRIAYLIKEKNVEPRRIMAITFTNKAAAEMRQRVDRIAGERSSEIWVATFHASAVRMLRRHIERLGYDSHFSIYDTDDQKTVMKKVFKELGIDTRAFKERNVLSAISRAKDELTGPDEYRKEAAGYAEEQTAKCYARYQAMLRDSNALDFDDLLFFAVRLFESCPEVLEYYQERFRYIMVDEYQDTNTAQFRFVQLLAGKYRNLCVVGDDDQSIYRFRGANIRNILSFEEAFPGAKVVKLEQNYRSTGNILSAANEVIKNNRGRKAKRLWTAGEEGEHVCLTCYETAQDEARGVIGDIRKNAPAVPYSDCAVLYRTNAQSRLLEERCVTLGVPYQLVGGVNFYQRREIKDVLSYLKTIGNSRDDLAAMRIINVPKRGIGQATIDKIAVFAGANGLGFYEGTVHYAENGLAGRAAGKLKEFIKLIESLREKAREMLPSELIRLVLEETGYAEELREEGEIEAESRMENIDELVSKAELFEEALPDGPEESGAEDDGAEAGVTADNAAAEDRLSVLARFLEEVALVADIDRMDDSADKITLMTLHAAKGLEFDTVYLTGLEDGLFPGIRSIGDREEMEEERRLCYVGITRAKRRLKLSWARTRMVNGETHRSDVSRFVKEIPEELLIKEDLSNGAWRSRQPEDDGLPFAPAYGFGSPVFGSSRSGSAGTGALGRGGSGRSAGRPAGAAAGTDGSKKVPFGKQFTVTKAERLDYGEGDRVLHARFGEGTVMKIVDGAKDFEVTVSFDGHGVKKLFAGFAKLKKL